MNVRHDLPALFHRALAAVNGRYVTSEYLRRTGHRAPDAIVAIGKAACAMAAGATDVYGDAVPCLRITKHGHRTDTCNGGTLLEAGHPQPDAASLAAGNALLRFIESRSSTAELLFLISGGTSSLVEVLPPSLSLEELRRINAWLLSNGWDIRAMNAVRKRLSHIKGGRLARKLDGRRARVLLISDVPDDDPSVIGSGPLFPDTSTLSAGALRDLPEWIRQHLRSAPEPPRPDAEYFAQVRHDVIASNAVARRAMVIAARELGYTAIEHDRVVTDAVETTARNVVETLSEGPSALHVWGGETTVRLPESPGRGGRNQHLALSVAEHIAGRCDVWFLAGATDGSDGSTTNAGAQVDGQSVPRGERRGLRVSEFLARADSAEFLEATGDVLVTGPTDTNVMDLLIGVRQPAPLA